MKSEEEFVFKRIKNYIFVESKNSNFEKSMNSIGKINKSYLKPRKNWAGFYSICRPGPPVWAGFYTGRWPGLTRVAGRTGLGFTHNLQFNKNSELFFFKIITYFFILFLIKLLFRCCFNYYWVIMTKILNSAIYLIFVY